MKPEAASAAGGAPEIHPWLVAASVMLTTFMVVLDTSVANVAIPHIAGGLSAANEEAIWVLTSYLVSNAIVLPATGWISRIFGRKRFLIFCIALFTGASCLCGLAPTLGILIFARVLQGAGGGAMQPISQAILLESFPAERRGTAMAVFSLGVVVAPIVGPTLGGWITDTSSWRWIFLINLPIGAISLFMVQTFVFDPHHIRKHRVRVIDYWGLVFMVLWLALLQIVLDKGQQEDWFSAPWICVATGISAVGMVAFLVREALTKHPIVDLRILKDRNFSIGCALTAVTAVILYGSTATLPLFLQVLMGYTAFLAGIALAPRGVGALIMSSTLGRIVAKCDGRFLVAGGFLLLGLSTWWLSEIDLEVSYRNIALPVFLTGMSISLIFVPMTTMTIWTSTTINKIFVYKIENTPSYASIDNR